MNSEIRYAEEEEIWKISWGEISFMISGESSVR